MPPHAPRLTIPSQRDDVEVVMQHILDQMDQHDFTEATQFAIRLAMEEAFSNAIRHGNQNNPEKSITVEFHIDSESIIIEIEDEGEGFDPNVVPDPTQDENIEIPSGRGLMLIRAYMSEVIFNDAGNRMRMRYLRTEQK